jgi:hypothetical protein
MTTTNPTIPAWLNVEAIVDPELKAQADELTATLRAKYDDLLELSCDAVRLMEAISESEPTDAGTDMIQVGEERIEVADAAWKIFGALNGNSALYAALSDLADMLHCAAEGGDTWWKLAEERRVSK